MRTGLRGSQAAVLAGLLFAMAGTAPAHAAAVGRTGSAAEVADGPDEELRLATIGYRLATANASQCRTPDTLTGLLVHEPGAYSPADRAAVSRLHRLTGGFGVRALVSGSAAARAGLRVGDEIIALNGNDLRRFRPDLMTSRASYDRTDAFVVLLAATLGKGAARVDVRRDGMIAPLVLHGDPGCGGRAALIREQGRRAWTNGRYIAVTPAMVDFVIGDDELAFIVAHEMAHNILDQADPDAPPSLMAALALVPAGGRGAELNADALAIGLMVRAGYDLSGVEGLLLRLRKMRPIDLALTHPGFGRRIAAVRSAIARVRSTPDR